MLTYASILSLNALNRIAFCLRPRSEKCQPAQILPQKTMAQRALGVKVVLAALLTWLTVRLRDLDGIWSIVTSKRMSRVIPPPPRLLSTTRSKFCLSMRLIFLYVHYYTYHCFLHTFRILFRHFAMSNAIFALFSCFPIFANGMLTLLFLVFPSLLLTHSNLSYALNSQHSVKVLQTTISKGAQKLPFYVQETLDFYTSAPKTITHLSEEYGKKFQFKERAAAASLFVGESGQSLASTRDSNDTLSPSSLSSSDNIDGSRVSSGRHPSANSAAAGHEARRSSKTPPVMGMLARSSSVTASSPSSSTGNIVVGPRSTRTPSQTQSGAPSPAMPTLNAQGTQPSTGPSNFPHSPKGTQNMLSSWLTTDSNSRAEERGRRNRRSGNEPQHVFQTLDANGLIADSTEVDLPIGMPLKPHLPPNHLLIRCKALAWNFATNCEVLQCTISLHDVTQRIKLSEDFHFDFIDDMEQGMLSSMLSEILGAAPHDISPESKARRALFPLSYRSGSVYMLVRIRASLKADTEESLEPYTVTGKMKDPQRWMDSCAKSARHLGHLRQPLAWGAIQVFNDASRLLLHDDTQIKLYRMRPALDDETFYDTITSTEKMKLAKQIEGSLSISGFLYTPEKYHLQNLLDPHLTSSIKFEQSVGSPAAPSTPASSPPINTTRVNQHVPAVSSTSSSSGTRTVIPDLVREIREFAQPFHQVYPNASYENHFYVYPLQVDVRNAQKIKAKSVAVRTFLMSHEGVPDRDAVQAIHGASNNPTFINSWTTTVDLDEKSPLFFDEIKIALPVRMTDTFHLYFQVYAINPKVVDPKKNKHHDLKAETLIGTAWVPLFKDNKFFKDGTYNVAVQPVMDTGAAPAGYLDTDLLNTSMEDRMTISFRTRLVSSLFTTSDHLARFYSGVIRSGDEYLRALEELSMVPDNEILFRFAPLLNFLFSMLCTPKLAEKLKVSEKNKKEVLNRTFLAIVDLASKITVLTMVNGVHSGISEELLMYVSCHFDPYQRAHNTSLSSNSAPSLNIAGASATAGTASNTESREYGGKDISFQAIASAWVKVLKSGTSDLKNQSKAGNGTIALGSATRLASISVQELGWFFLSLIVRSLALKVNERREAGTDDVNRNKRYTEKFSKSLTSLITLSHELRRHSKAGFEFFNRMLARFIIDLYRYMDRGFVSQLVSMYLAELEKDGRAHTAFYRFTFLQEIATFEHYVPLNMPSVRPLDAMIGSSCGANGATSVSGPELRLLFWKTHFLAGHLINEFRTLLQLGEEGRLTRIKSIAKLRDLLWRHSVDPRYCSTTEPWQQRLASMYFPLAALAFEHLDVLLGATSGLGVATSTASASPEWKDWCYVVIWILRHANREITLRNWRSTLRASAVYKFFKFLRLAHETFAKPLAIAQASSGGGNSATQNFVSPVSPSTGSSSGTGTPLYSPSPAMGTSMSSLPAFAMASGLSGSTSNLPGLSGSPAFGQSSSSIGSSGSGTPVPPLTANAMASAAAAQALAASNPSPSTTPTGTSSNPNGLNNVQMLVNEMVLTMVDAVDFFIEGYETQLGQSNFSKAFSELASLVVNLLRSPTTSLATCATIGLARFFCSTLKKPLFRDNSTSTACSDLCSELLLLCQQQHPQVMASATAVLYLMIKENYAEMGDFSKMRRHTTVALSNALKASVSAGRIEDLSKALEAMESYGDASLAPGFKDQVKALVSGHRAILRDCARVEQFSLDFLDLKVEYSYNIANAYRDCPELRVQWLIEMAKLFEKGERWEEAGMCRLQAASLVGQYLSMHPMTPATLYHAIGTTNSTFLRLAPELLTNEPPIGPTPPISASWFTEESLLTTLLDACHNFAKAEQFESAVDAITLYVQVCMDTKKYAYVAQYGSLMQEWANKADKAIRSQSRIPSNFYRVGFYGNEFGADNGKEFIYKAPPAQRLADFTEKLVARYSPSFAVEVLNNKPISEQTLQPGRHYVQIVNLEPYFEADVNKEISWLDRTRNVKRFYFETSYSPDGGRPSEDVAKMYKRRELVTAKLAFPNFYLRSPVEKKETKILQPYDCALDLMVALTTKLKAALNCVPIVAKNLQIILQGAVLAQVNAGPAAIIATFLANSDEHPAEAIEKLRESMRAFIRACNFGLILNKKLIEDQPDTAALQEAMMSAFAALQAEASKHIEL